MVFKKKYTEFKSQTREMGRCSDMGTYARKLLIPSLTVVTHICIYVPRISKFY